MGAVVNRIHVELFGLPGCGKSTAGHLLAEKLNAAGIRTAEPSYFIDHAIAKRPRMLLKLLLLSVYALLHPKKTGALRKIVQDNGYSGANAVKQCANLVQKVLGYADGAEPVVIWDEGMVQAAVSLSLNGRVPAAENLRRLREICGGKMLTVYLREPQSVVLERMRRRNRHDSRIEKETDETRRLEMLQRFERDCEALGADADLILENGSAEAYAQAMAERVLQRR